MLMVGIAEGQVDYDQLYRDTAKNGLVLLRWGCFSVEALFWNEEVVQAWVAKYGKENLLSAEEELAYHQDFCRGKNKSLFGI